MANVSIEEMAAFITKELANYSDEVAETTIDEIKNVTKEALGTLKTHSKIPIGRGVYGKKNKLKGKKYGHYKDGFYSKNTIKSVGKNKGYFAMTVANRKWQIGHLLERGHAKRGGGRTREFPHWIDAQKVADTLPERLARRLGR